MFNINKKCRRAVGFAADHLAMQLVNAPGRMMASASGVKCRFATNVGTATSILTASKFHRIPESICVTLARLGLKTVRCVTGI
ncbi:MAG: hypothetical protein H0X02_09340 [Nitrosomonas sp.]|nr:hypothetical protein [Nitrosomonas sp.]